MSQQKQTFSFRTFFKRTTDHRQHTNKNRQPGGDKLKVENESDENGSSGKRFFTLITGASSGIGKAIAKKCASMNMNLLLIALPCSGLEEFADELKNKYKVDVHHICLNLTSVDAPYKILAYCQMNNLHVNILVNNAGLGGWGAFEKTRHVDIQYMMTLNMNSTVSLTRLFLSQIKSSGKGYILNVGSLAALFAVPYKSIYSATKSFVVVFSRSLHFELKDESVVVSCLCPGPTLTNNQVKRATNSLGWRARFFILSAEQVADVAVSKMLKGNFLIVPGWPNKLLSYISYIVPKAIAGRILAKTFKKQTVDQVSLR